MVWWQGRAAKGSSWSDGYWLSSLREVWRDNGMKRRNGKTSFAFFADGNVCGPFFGVLKLLND